MTRMHRLRSAHFATAQGRLNSLCPDRRPVYLESGVKCKQRRIDLMRIQIDLGTGYRTGGFRGYLLESACEFVGEILAW